MKRTFTGSPPQLVEFWLADGTLAEPGVSFALSSVEPPPVQRTRLPLRMTVLTRRKRLPFVPIRMS